MSETTETTPASQSTEPTAPQAQRASCGHHGHHRGYRRRRGVRAVMFLLLLAGVFFAGQTFAGHRNPSDEAIRERMSWVLEKVVDRVDGTDEQLAALETIADAHFPTPLALRKEGKELRMKLAEALLADTPDPQAIEALRKQLVGLVDRATVELSAALREGTGVLTPEQRREILQKLSERFGG